jgi:hypothetical protein
MLNSFSKRSCSVLHRKETGRERLRRERFPQKELSRENFPQKELSRESFAQRRTGQRKIAQRKLFAGQELPASGRAGIYAGRRTVCRKLLPYLKSWTGVRFSFP